MGWQVFIPELSSLCEEYIRSSNGEPGQRWSHFGPTASNRLIRMSGELSMVKAGLGLRVEGVGNVEVYEAEAPNAIAFLYAGTWVNGIFTISHLATPETEINGDKIQIQGKIFNLRPSPNTIFRNITHGLISPDGATEIFVTLVPGKRSVFSTTRRDEFSVKISRKLGDGYLLPNGIYVKKLDKRVSLFDKETGGACDAIISYDSDNKFFWLKRGERHSRIPMAVMTKWFKGEAKLVDVIREVNRLEPTVTSTPPSRKRGPPE